MQISSLSSPGLAGSTASYASIRRTESFYESLSSVNVDFSPDGDTVTITASESSLFIESFYKAEGLTVSAPSTASADETLETGETASTLIENTPTDFLSIIKERVEYLLEQAAKQSEQFRESLLNGTGLYTAGGKAAISLSNTVVKTSDTVSLTLETSYFSAENTADRIVNFALAFYTGGDKEAYVAEITDAIMKGFEEAKVAFGGFLPDISYKTMDIVNQKLAAFASSTDAV